MASDLTQETLKRVIEKVRVGAIDPERGSIQGFAFGIAVNVRREHLKFSARQRLYVVNGESFEMVSADRSNPEELLTVSRQLSRLKSAIAQLSVAEQEVVSLMVDSELSVADAAKILGIPEGTVKSHMSRAKDRLRQLMQ